MYRDEKEALEAQLHALIWEAAIVRERLKAINDHKKPKQTITRDKWICAVSACGLVLGSFAAMWGLFLTDTPLKPKAIHASFDELDASCTDEYGVISPNPEKIIRTLEDISMTAPCNESAEHASCESVCDWRVECDGMDNNCSALNNDDFGVVFVLDTSVSMTHYLESVKRAINQYAEDSCADRFLFLIASGDGRDASILSAHRGNLVSTLSEIGINSELSHEPIPALMELGAISSVGTRRYLVAVFTDEEPQAASYYDGKLPPENTLCSPPFNADFAVFTTPENVREWQALGSCFRVFGDL